MDRQADPVAVLEERSGRRLAGAFAFGDSEELADALLDLVRRGRKRATAGAVAELPDDEPFPAPGLCWGLLDGRGQPSLVMETTHVRVGRLDSVDPAFAWEEGEGDRTREAWLDDHRRYFRRQGFEDPDVLETAFERFRIVWPEEDVPTWLAGGVRQLRVEERPWAAALLTEHHGTDPVPVGDRHVGLGALPALVAERDGERLGLLTFRPWPDGVTDVVTVDAIADPDDVAALLLQGIRELARREGWSSVRGAGGA